MKSIWFEWLFFGLDEIRFFDSNEIGPIPPKIIPSHLNSYRLSQNHAFSLKIIPSHPKSFRLTQSLSVSSKVIPSLPKSFRLTQIPSIPPEPIRFPAHFSYFKNDLILFKIHSNFTIFSITSGCC